SNSHAIARATLRRCGGGYWWIRPGIRSAIHTRRKPALNKASRMVGERARNLAGDTAGQRLPWEQPDKPIPGDGSSRRRSLGPVAKVVKHVVDATKTESCAT
ncbi:MAG: hypothetical protein ACRDSE_16655, partial [Pseudonocardiaceae bacterium]